MVRQLKRGVKIVIGLIILVGIIGALNFGGYLDLDKITGFAISEPDEPNKVGAMVELDPFDYQTNFTGVFNVIFWLDRAFQEDDDTRQFYLKARGFPLPVEDAEPGTVKIVNKYRPQYDVACIQDCQLFCDANQMQVNEKSYSQKWGRCLCRCDTS